MSATSPIRRHALGATDQNLVSVLGRAPTARTPYTYDLVSALSTKCSRTRIDDQQSRSSAIR